MSAASDILKLIKEKEIEFVDLRFTDPRGKLQHMTQDLTTIDEDFLNDGTFFDGSSIAGWKAINESDMILKPDLSRTFVDPFTSHNTLVIFCDIMDPIKNDYYERDPRSIAKKAEAYLKTTGIGDTIYFGPEPEFFIFDDVKISNTMQKVSFQVDSNDELGTMFDTMVRNADNMQIYKYAVQMVAHSFGKTATFMAKPIKGDNGSGMHCHQSIWKAGKPLFAGDKYAGLSQECLYYIGGIIKHAKALNAFTNSTTNSYKRLIPGFEAPVILAYSARNRSASCRIPFSSNPKGKRVEVRFPDAAGNPYLTFASMLMAGIDGIKNKIDPGKPFDKDLYSLSAEELKGVPQVCGSLREALENLDKDRSFLTSGGVFTDDQIDAYIELKMTEVYNMEHTPHPVEYQMYYSC